VRSLATASWTLRFLILSSLLGFCSASAFCQGGPPYYTNDTGTPGNHLWEINIAYMPFFYTDSSVSHIPDVDVNFGIGGHVQLTYESAWLRGYNSPAAPKYGLEQDQLGVKWNFFDDPHSRLAISVFPQLSINNPNHSVQRGLAPPGASFLLPIELSKKLWKIHLNWEAGYNFVHLGPDGWVGGFVAGSNVTKKLELDAEFYSVGYFRASQHQETIDAGARYKVHPDFTILLMAGRSIAPASTHQPFFVGYFGVKLLLPPRKADEAK
jgi:hypothetical protein